MHTTQVIQFDDFDQRIADLAASAGLKRQERFPFLIEGQVENLQWHVIDGSRLGGEGQSHRDHLNASVRSRREQTRATLVGFYSATDQGIFTHMGSSTHVHCVVYEPLSSGHVDHVVLPAGITVRLPK